MHLYSDFNIYKSEIFGFLLSFLVVFLPFFWSLFFGGYLSELDYYNFLTHIANMYN